jgi:NADH-quinone oxidoreductase subunit N
MSTFDPMSWLAIGPQLALTVTALAVMVLYALHVAVRVQAAVSSVGLFAAVAATVAALLRPEALTFPAVAGGGGVQTALRVSFVALDGYAGAFFLVFLFVALITSVVAGPYLAAYKSRLGEFYIVLLFATVGMMFMAAAQDMLVLYLGLETMSLSAYVLAGLFVERDKSKEAALKYFLTGAFASAIFLYGVAFLYGATGSITFEGIRTTIANPGHATWAVMGAGLLLAGFAFKVAAVPFHMWAPDVYQGAPTPVSGLMAVGIKAAGFAALTRVVLVSFNYVDGPWITWMLYGLSVATMVWGNVAAVAQTNIKRLLAYSSIAHAGYLLIAVTAGNELTAPAIILYMTAYAFMTLGAFAVVTLLEREGERYLDIASWAGLARRHPYLAVCMAVFLLSLAGIPPTVGFLGKWYVFAAAVTRGYVTLTIIGVATSMVSVYYYLRVVYVMFMREAPEDEALSAKAEPTFLAAKVAAYGFAAMVLFLGCFPGQIIALARAAGM